MTLKLILNNGKRIQRTRPGAIIAQNDKKSDGRIVTRFYDAWDWNNMCLPVPFAEVPTGTVRLMRGATPVVSTFAK